MTGPEHSAWLSKSTVSVAVPLNSVESEHSSSSPSSMESLPDSTGLVLEAIKWAEKLSCRSDCESTLFSSLMNEIISLPVTTVMHIPHSARSELAEVFAAELKHASVDGLWGFARFFLFSKAVLRCPPRGGKKKQVIVKTILLSRIRRWKEGDLVSLWEEARLDSYRSGKNFNANHTSLESANAKQAFSLAREGRYGDAMRLLSSSGCAPHDDLSAVSELQERHPYHSLPVWITEIPAPLVVTSSSVLEALRGFPKASSPGGAKLRCQHLLDVIEGSTTSSAQDCLANLTDLVCFLLSGQAHPSIAPWLTSAPLTVLYKKQGGIRPIAVGVVLRRLTSRLCCSAVRQNCPDVFLPTGQIGVGICGGLEAAVHSLSTVLDSQGSNPDLCCLKIDFSNAFKECNRSSFLDRVHKDFPEIFVWTQWCYHCEGEL
ncbi:uncharacterized protein LOC134186046 [Corticium candelabrum]|uniref:uncharacterized protein LOC134186046 n=1 Tax=Corticium candelabrum TaxID=121492 RepID=UPI002E2625AD|nr:uncharacterized protein LOC134186046 [Corticium candelabrum]